MKLQTDQFGELEFDEKLIIHFQDGIIGFDHLQRFLLIKTDDEIFHWLFSVDEPEIGFPIFPIRFLFKEYPEVENCEPFGIVKLQKILEEITINVKAPLYLNLSDMKGFQRILDMEGYPIDQKLFIKD